MTDWEFGLKCLMHVARMRVHRAIEEAAKRAHHAIRMDAQFARRSLGQRFRWAA